MARSKTKWPKDRFIQIPHPILKSIAYTNCGAWARTLLIELMLQFNGKNNGDLSAPYSLMKTRGFNSSGTLSKASKELENNGKASIAQMLHRVLLFMTLRPLYFILTVLNYLDNLIDLLEGVHSLRPVLKCVV